MDKEFYIFRFYDDNDVMKVIREEFKFLTSLEMLDYLSFLRRSHYGVAVYKRLDISKNARARDSNTCACDKSNFAQSAELSNKV